MCSGEYSLKWIPAMFFFILRLSLVVLHKEADKPSCTRSYLEFYQYSSYVISRVSANLLNLNFAMNFLADFLYMSLTPYQTYNCRPSTSQNNAHRYFSVETSQTNTTHHLKTLKYQGPKLVFGSSNQ